jgi:uncharacterized protein (UPF0333 family)
MTPEGQAGMEFVILAIAVIVIVAIILSGR